MTNQDPWAHDYHKDWGLVVLGPKILELTWDGRSFTNITVPVFVSAQHACIKIVNSDLLFATSIFNNGAHKGTFMYHRTSDNWGQVQSMPTLRRYPICGMTGYNIISALINLNLT